jgi:CrcB protein
MLGDALLVSLGAVPGAWLRFVLVNRLEPVLPHRHWGTLVVNLAACFGLGLLTALRAHGQASAAFMLLLGTGFLGSLSTFSTLAAELDLCLQNGHQLACPSWRPLLGLNSDGIFTATSSCQPTPSSTQTRGISARSTGSHTWCAAALATSE